MISNLFAPKYHFNEANPEEVSGLREKNDTIVTSWFWRFWRIWVLLVFAAFSYLLGFNSAISQRVRENTSIIEQLTRNQEKNVLLIEKIVSAVEKTEKKVAKIKEEEEMPIQVGSVLIGWDEKEKVNFMELSEGWSLWRIAEEIQGKVKPKVSILKIFDRLTEENSDLVHEYGYLKLPWKARIVIPFEFVPAQ
ncbi:MAG: hypothetical protein CEN89_91 [Candidatus Berkelbacteria bacterium Licking1014_7]|uniref:Uncharacterized protein n=1 Tax=Candidatus Berkelbacteria bacterium Licking1014_7 TaxID=2017147 RepID=A0A554LKL5_9BACT|nr:MAG: hypothetical protein CEN89_91 [Candidatus Berkelbacteria bacterium Licking1014_7]